MEREEATMQWQRRKAQEPVPEKLQRKREILTKGIVIRKERKK